MLMRLPDSGSILGSLLSNLGQPVTAMSSGDTVAAVTDSQLTEALAALVRGDIEFVILEDGEAFVQVAGEGDGPYQLQFDPGGGASMSEVPGGVTREVMARVMRGYLAGDPAWQSGEWQRLT